MPGWEPLIVCAGPDCHFAEIMLFIKNAIHDMVLISTVFVIIALIVAGFKLLASQGNENALKEVKDIFGKIIWGYVWILAAWVIVHYITTALIKDSFNIFLK